MHANESCSANTYRNSLTTFVFVLHAVITQWTVTKLRLLNHMTMEMASLMRRPTRTESWESNEEHHSAASYGSCNMAAGSDITLGLTANIVIYQKPSKTRRREVFLQTPAALVVYTRMAGGEEKEKRQERVKTGIRNFLKGSHLISWLTWL